MDVSTKNMLLGRGELGHPELWPHKAEAEAHKYYFTVDFGLRELPLEPGLITVRGPRQYGKSTWLETELYKSVQTYGAGSTFYLNGDELVDADALTRVLEETHTLFSPHAKVKRLFIDEITAVAHWEKSVKRVIDRGLFRDVLMVSTGSKALDLRRGTERLPGRKGKLRRSEFIFLPISYREFKTRTQNILGEKSWVAYLLSGGSPLACNDICQVGCIPDYLVQMIRDWIFGDVVASGRSRMNLTHVLQQLFAHGGNPLGYAKLAREAGLANNTVASGYIEQLSDLLCVLPAWAWDANKCTHVMRKPCKFQFINLAAVVATHPAQLRSISDFEQLPTATQGLLLEWLVAQELWRRSVLAGTDNPEAIGFWQSEQHEIDFVTAENEWVEVKLGSSGPMEFMWFPKVFPKKNLTVVCSTPFEMQQVRGISIDEFLMAF